jgi:thiol-disulfide isomerase/thioredoxin
MLPLGTKAPDFKLLDTVSGKILSLDQLKSEKATVIMFICNHCPFVKYIDPELVKLVADFQPKGISFVAISSNDIENYPQDAPELMTVEAKKAGYAFPYLYDSTQEVAKAYSAACTPDFFIFDANLACVYRGQFDDARPGNGLPITGNDIIRALTALLNHEKVNESQMPSMGCGIKWK